MEEKMKKTLLSAIFVILLFFCCLGFSGQTVSAKSTPVKLAKKSATLTITKTNNGTLYGAKKITVKKTKNITIKKITYKSKNKKIATVSSGKVKARKKGSTKITVTVKYKKKGNKKVYKKVLTFKVKVTVKDKRTNQTTNNGNTSKVESYWYSESNTANVITGTTLGTAVPSKSKGKYMKTFNIGALEQSGKMVTGNSCVTAEVYSAFGYDKKEYYVIYIKTNDSNGYLYSKSDFKTLVSDALNTDYYDTIILGIVFENKTNLYCGTSLFQNMLDDLGYFIHPNYGGIYNLGNLNTSACKYFTRMFDDTFSSISIDKINFYLPETFNTSSARTMNGMFMDFGYDHKNSTFTLPESFDTSKVEDLDSMFYSLSTTTLNLPKKFVIAKFNEGTSYASSADVDNMFYASDIVYINAKTPLDLKYCTDCICFSRLATLANQKSFVDSLDFTYIEDFSLALYDNSDKDFIDYITNKILTEAKNLTTFRFLYVEVSTDNLTADLKNYQHITDFSNIFDSASIKTIILQNAVISDADYMFNSIDCQILDLSTCTFTDDCNYEKMFSFCENNDYDLTIYVKDAAMQAKIIEVYNQDNPNKPIDKNNVIIGSYK